MKEGIHPDIQTTQVKCACGNVIETGSTKEDTVQKFVLLVILSTQESKSLLIQAAELISSENVMVLKSKKLDTADCGVFFI